MLRVVLAAVARSAGMGIEMMSACKGRGEVQVGQGCMCVYPHVYTHVCTHTRWKTSYSFYFNLMFIKTF